MTAWDQVCPAVVRIFISLLSMIRVRLPWLVKGDLWQLSAFRRIWLQADEGSQGKPLPAFAIFLVPSAQNNQCTKAAYFGVAHPKLLVISWGDMLCCPSLPYGSPENSKRWKPQKNRGLGRGRAEWVEHRGLWGPCIIVRCRTVTVGTCPYTFVKAHRRCSTKTELTCKL